jgi:hypothetical protein
VNERELRDALRDAADGGEDARERSWRVVQAAYAGYEPPRRPRRRTARALAAAVAVTGVAAAGVAAAATDSDVGRWVRGVLGAGEPGARPVLARVPGGGRLLVTAGDSAWVVAGDGAKRRLGRYAGASWSPRGRFVVAWRGHQLAALDPRGRTRWSLARSDRITLARWGPADGFRIAYLTDSALRIVNGDGTGDRRHGPARGDVAPAWRPDAAHVLAYVDRRGRVDVVAVDARRRLWRSAPLAGAVELAWSPDGRRLAVVARRRVLLFDRGGARLAVRAAPTGSILAGAGWSPRSGTLAVVRHRPASGRSDLLLLRPRGGLRERTLFRGPGRFGAPAWSPDGRSLLLPWREADQWLFLRPAGDGRPRAVAAIAGQFRSGTARPGFPRAVEWCCAAPPGTGP